MTDLWTPGYWLKYAKSSSYGHNDEWYEKCHITIFDFKQIIPKLLEWYYLQQHEAVHCASLKYM